MRVSLALLAAFAAFQASVVKAADPLALLPRYRSLREAKPGGEGDPYYDENGEKRDPHMEKKDPYEKHEDPYAEKQPYEGEEKEMFEDVHAHSEFTVRPNSDLVANVTNGFGHTCAFHFTTGAFEGDEVWDLLLFDVESHHECSAVKQSDEPTKAKYTSVALVVKDEHGTEFTIANRGSHPASDDEFVLEKTDIGYGLHSIKDVFKGELMKVAIHFLPKKEEF